jgi:hypothetical protein
VKPSSAPARSAGWSRDAHKVDFVQIYYLFHPYFKQTFKVIRVVKDHLIVKGVDGRDRGIPTWMTEEEMCKRIKISPYPYCSHESLKRLKELLFCIGEKT